MDNWSEISKSIRAVLYERIVSPFYGIFVLTWIIWNWKIVFVILFEPSSKFDGTKYEFINANLLDPNNLLLNPLWSSLCVLVIFGIIATMFFVISMLFKRMNKWLKAKIYDNKLITEAERKQLIEDVIRKENDLNDLIKESLRKQNELTDKNSELLKSLTKNKTDLNEISSKLKDKTADYEKNNSELKHIRNLYNENIKSTAELLSLVLHEVFYIQNAKDENKTTFETIFIERINKLIRYSHNKDVAQFLRTFRNLDPKKKYSDHELEKSIIPEFLVSAVEANVLARDEKDQYYINDLIGNNLRELLLRTTLQ